ncbi:MAG: hypothetical protein HWE30_17310 [Methylocystaceae bacterium]|nr:hypothetical protein [Methylocystaceae bacterium]
MNVRIFIATTEGPVEVQRITKEDPDVRSVICLDGTAKALPIARAYDAFVKEPTGVVERSYKHPSFRMDVSAPITDGESWQLGAFCAHAFFAEDRLAAPGEKVDNALWLTGELDRDLNVRPVDHIKEKLIASQDLFAQMRAEDIRLFCFIPGGAGLVPEDEFLEEMTIDGDLLRLESIVDIQRIIRRFDLKDPYPVVEEDEDDDDLDEDGVIDLYKQREKDAEPIKDNGLFKSLAVGACIVAMVVGLYLQFEDNIMALRANGLKIGISELRANADEGCEKPDKIPLVRDGAAFPSSKLDGLCALEITLNNMATPTYMWAFAQRIEDGHFLLADRESLLEPKRQKGLIGWRITLPKRLSKSIDYRLVALASDKPLADAVNRMLRSSFGEDTPDWQKIKARLEEEDITVLSALHSLEK